MALTDRHTADQGGLLGVELFVPPCSCEHKSSVPSKRAAEVRHLRFSRKVGIAALLVLASLVPLSVLANGNGNDATTDEQTSGKCRMWRGWRWGWFGLGPGNDKTVDEVVDLMTEKLGLTEEEADAVTPIVQEIRDLREQLKTKMQELNDVIGPKVDAYRESVMANGFGRCRRMGWRFRQCCPPPLPCQDTSEDASGETSPAE